MNGQCICVDVSVILGIRKVAATFDPVRTWARITNWPSLENAMASPGNVRNLETLRGIDAVGLEYRWMPYRLHLHCCMLLLAWKGLKRQKEAKTIKNRQETGKRQRVKSKTKKPARNHSRISPTQSKKETKKSKSQDKVKRANYDKCSKSKELIWKIEVSRTKFAKC
ncbi:hypothetical protein Tco_0897530 [Tanacetum coccineum]